MKGVLKSTIFSVINILLQLISLFISLSSKAYISLIFIVPLLFLNLYYLIKFLLKRIEINILFSSRLVFLFFDFILLSLLYINFWHNPDLLIIIPIVDFIIKIIVYRHYLQIQDYELMFILLVSDPFFCIIIINVVFLFNNMVY